MTTLGLSFLVAVGTMIAMAIAGFGFFAGVFHVQRMCAPRGGLLATFVPALRASRVDPLVALRYE